MFDTFTDNHGNTHRWGPERRLYAPVEANERPFGQGCGNEDELKVHDEIMSLSSAIAAAQARILELMTTHGDRLAEGGDPAAWLACAGGMKLPAARRHLRLAEKLAELPKIKESFAAGEISFDKTETIAQVANAETEDHLLIWAQNGTCSQLGSITAGFRRAKVYAQGAAAAQRDRDLTYHYTEDGVFRLRAQMPAEQGALVEQAIEAAEKLLWQEEEVFSGELDGAEQQQQARQLADRHGARRADSLVALAETFLSHGLTDAPVASRYQVMVHVDQAALKGDEQGTSEIEDRVGISADTARRISCDCTIMGLLEGDGIPLKLGRSRRTISPALRKALKARDRHCVFPGCTNARALDGHHVRHWIDDGLTEPENVTLLCRRHHRLLHEGRYTMTFDGKLASFFRPDGSEVERVPKYPGYSEVEIAEWCAVASTDIDTWSTWIDRYDLGDAVSYLCHHDPDLREQDAASADVDIGHPEQELREPPALSERTAAV
ncbi:MAG: HNH endonuclease [Actinomycetota bacterium]|nr:HNH endonuclease [Actinomycetota bacterium]